MAFGLGGIAANFFPVNLLAALPSRLLGLLEHDLLQALPLYVLMGCLLNRLPLAQVLTRVASRWLGHGPAAPFISALGLGALLAPMNGSVGAGVAMLSRAVLPGLDAQQTPSERSAALICAASTVGVVVPPSLVLILLGDAVMRAHTEALNVTRAATRVINTQDIFHGALLPSLAVLLLFFAVTAWQHRGVRSPGPRPMGGPMPTRGDTLTACCSVLGIVGLLASVTLGWMLAVEGAATGAMALLAYGVFSKNLTRSVWAEVLHDTLAITGSLFAVLTAATAFTMVLRALETDVWMNQFLHQLGGGPEVALAVALGIFGVSAFVLDAFEITFVVIPVVLPSLLTLVNDVTWVAVLILLVLQISFLLPPFGYAVLMVGSVMKRRLHMRSLAQALAPYLAVQALVLAAVLFWPQLVWHSHSSSLASGSDASSALTDAQLQELLERQSMPPEPSTSAP
jgi:tripartite ATP-independent transporter DctM subunit